MTRETGIDLYDRDFYAWTADQAERLRRLAGDNRFDVGHVAEEIADLGKAEKRALQSHLRVALQHLLLMAASTAGEPRDHWMDEILRHVREAFDVLGESPSLRHRVSLTDAWTAAVTDANAKLRIYGEPLIPSDLGCPFHLDDLHPDRFDMAAAVDALRAGIDGAAADDS